jgi:proteasome assembly chaperone (PAC2) family protein
VDVVRVSRNPPNLRSPVLVAAFEGWNDAGESASGAAGVLARRFEATAFASIDPEEFFDFQANRPRVRSARGRRRIEWPSNRFAWASADGSVHDLVLLQGTEPNLRWRTFGEAIADLAEELGVRLVVTLGALQVDVPHTRAVPVSGGATSEALREVAGVRPSSYEGPTGITGVLNHMCADRGMEAVSLWAGVPHYLAGTPYIAGALALVERVVPLLGATVDLGLLATDAREQRGEISQLVAEDEDLSQYVAELEERFDEEPEVIEMPGRPVSGDEIAAEFERYLRDRDS